MRSKNKVALAVELSICILIGLLEPTLRYYFNISLKHRFCILVRSNIGRTAPMGPPSHNCVSAAYFTKKKTYTRINRKKVVVKPYVTKVVHGGVPIFNCRFHPVVPRFCYHNTRKEETCKGGDQLQLVIHFGPASCEVFIN